MRVELFGVALHQLLLAADIVQAVDVLADAVFVARKVANLIAIVVESAIVLGDLRLFVGDALQFGVADHAFGPGSAAVPRHDASDDCQPDARAFKFVRTV